MVNAPVTVTVFEFFAGVRLEDAGVHDALRFNGVRLTGGVDTGMKDGKTVIYSDKLVSGITYKQVGKDVWVYNRYADIDTRGIGKTDKDGVFIIKNFDIADASNGFGASQFYAAQRSKLGLSFKTVSPLDNALRLTARKVATKIQSANDNDAWCERAYRKALLAM